MFYGNSFLERCDPRAKLVALFLVMPLLLSQPIFSWRWGVIAALAILAVSAGLLSIIRSLVQKLLYLRWLFLALLLFHGWFTPGQPLWHGWDVPTWEGVREGLQQALRLVFLVSLSWILVKTTTPLQLLAGLYRLLGGLETLGIPVKRGLATTAFALGQIPSFAQKGAWTGDDLTLRASHTAQTHWQARLYRTAHGGEALLFRLSLAARWQEEALHVRGFSQGLPFSVLQKTSLGWRDFLLMACPTTLFLELWLQGIS